VALYGVVEETVLNICQRELPPDKFKLVRAYGQMLPEIMDSHGVALTLEDNVLAYKMFQIIKSMHEDDPVTKLHRSARAMHKIISNQCPCEQFGYDRDHFSWEENLHVPDDPPKDGYGFPNLNIPLSPKKQNTKSVQAISVARIFDRKTGETISIAWSYCLTKDIFVPEYGVALALMRAWLATAPSNSRRCASQREYNEMRHPDKVLLHKIEDPKIRKRLMLD